MEKWLRVASGAVDDKKGTRSANIILTIPSQPLPPGFTPAVSLARRLMLPGAGMNANVFYIQRGIVQLLSTENQRQPVIVGFRSVGWIVGNVFGRSSREFSISARAITDCEVCAFFYSDVSKLSESELRSYFGHIGLMTGIAGQAALDQQQSFRFHHPLRRVASLLRDFARADVPFGDSEYVKVTIPLTQVEVAQFLWISPEHVNRVLHKLHSSGVITGGKWPNLEINTQALLAATRGLTVRMTNNSIERNQVDALR